MWSCSSHQPLDHYCCPLCKGLKEHSSNCTNFDGLFQDIAPSDLLVRVGEYHVLNTNEAHSHIDRKIRKVVTHRNFDKFTYEYDIALLEMHDGPINYQVCVCEDEIHPKCSENQFLQPNMIPICLPANDNSLVGEVGVLSCLFPFSPSLLLLRWEQSQAGAGCPSTDKYLPFFGRFNCPSYQTANVCGCIGKNILKTNIQQKMVLGILVKTSGSQRSLCARAPHQGVRTAVREIAEVPWW